MINSTAKLDIGIQQILLEATFSPDVSVQVDLFQQMIDKLQVCDFEVVDHPENGNASVRILLGDRTRNYKLPPRPGQELPEKPSLKPPDKPILPGLKPPDKPELPSPKPPDKLEIKPGQLSPRK